MYITENERTTQVINEYDVIVSGGGMAGISSALASARNSAKTLLVEKMFMLGGLATAGLVTVYLPLCDGNGMQVSYGIAEELLRLSIKYGYEPSINPAKDINCEAWLNDGSRADKISHRFQVQFNASVFAILCEQLLLQNGVEILYGTSICDCQIFENKIQNIIIENKSGRQAIKGHTFIDATGDADLCKLSGEDTIVFNQGNILASWYYYFNNSSYGLKMLGFSDVPDKYKSDIKNDCNKRRYKGIDGNEITEMTIASHDSLLRDFLKSGGINSTHALTSIATIPQLRMTRRIDGANVLDDTEYNKYFEDSIGIISDWRKKGPIYEIPFSCLYGKKIKNLLTAGRCISVTDSMWDISRVIPACAVTGQAAGTAASMTDDFSKIDLKKLQSKLEYDKVKLHISQL